jgi:competence protein ComEA
MALTTTTAPRIWVQVAGAVACPGVYQMEAGSRVFEAILEAGGFTEEADEEAVALAAQLSDGCRVYVPTVGEVDAGKVENPVVSSAGISGGSSADSPAGGSSAAPVSLNSATLEQLDALPGVGPSIAQQIITYRETNGPFTSVEQLTDVPGIGPAKLEQLRPLVGL